MYEWKVIAKLKQKLQATWDNLLQRPIDKSGIKASLSDQMQAQKAALDTEYS